METIIAAFHNKPAGEGFGSVLLSGLLAVGVMAVIYGVLGLMNRVWKKKSGSEKQQLQQPPKSSGTLFARVLEKQMRQRSEKKHGTDEDDRDMRA